jgi:SNF2 family DNA or RNA helicase
LLLKGGFTEEEISEILECKKQDCIPHLKNIIFDLNSDDCEAILDQGLLHLQSGKSLDSFVPEIEDYYMGELTDLQTVGCQFLYLAKSAMLADDVGLGKTVQVAGLINLLKLNGEPKRLLFLGEKAGVRELALKLTQFTGDFFYPMDGGATADNVKKFLSLYDVNNVSLVAPHSILSNETFKKYALKNTFDVVVFDESSMLKRISTNIYKNTRVIARATKRFIELNATPVEVLGSDIYNQLNLLSPNWLYSKAEFNRKYARKTFFMGRINLIFNKDASDFLKEVSLRYLARTRSSLPDSSNKNNLGVTLEILPSVEQKNLLKVSSFYAYIADYPSRLKDDIPVNEQTCPKLGALMSLLQIENI